jgi:hypothetical protein
MRRIQFRRPDTCAQPAAGRSVGVGGSNDGSMENPFDLTGRVGIVTGADSPTGIGFLSAMLFAELGVAVLIISATDPGEERGEELRSAGGDVGSVTADLADPAGARQIVDVALAGVGSPCSSTTRA